MSANPRLTLSITILLGKLKLSERPAAASALGFDSVESWWAWESLTASAHEIDRFALALSASAVDLYLVNVAEGGPTFGGRGLAAIPEAGEEFWANAESVLALVERTGARYINVLAGNLPGSGPTVGIATFIERVAELADRAAQFGTGVVIEHLNPIDHPDYLFTDANRAIDCILRIRDLVSGSNVGLLADLYHLGRSGIDPVAFVNANTSIIHHVQLADAPGRGRPGSGSLAIADTVAALEENGYAGRFGLEYLPDPSAGIPSPAEFWRELRS